MIYRVAALFAVRNSEQFHSVTGSSLEGPLLRQSSPRIVYLSFDRFPSPKGAATHIDAFVTALGEAFGNVELLTIPSEDDERQESSSDDLSAPSVGWARAGVIHHKVPAPGPDLFQRVLSFRVQAWDWFQQNVACSDVCANTSRHFETKMSRETDPRPIVHFRSIFEGYPLARHKDRFCQKLIYEVNGLPSIELKYHYPAVAEDQELLGKLAAQEKACLQSADLVLTVSDVNANHLVSRGVPEERIRVIPNGVDLKTFFYRAPAERLGSAEEPPLKMLYSGTMSSWQGVSIAIDALASYCRDLPATLTLVGHSRARQKRELVDYAYKMGVHDRVNWVDPVCKPELAAMHHAADVVLAPLLRNDRNLIQGCCPLKVLEAMASGTPLIASDLPVVRELATDHEHALLVRPGSGKAIKDAILALNRDPTLKLRLSRAARKRVEEHFGWRLAQQRLVDSYQTLLRV